MTALEDWFPGASSFPCFGASPDAFYKRTPLHIAAHHGQVDTLKVLLDAGGDANVPDVYGKLTVHAWRCMS